jgi:hypothetical protein
MDSQIPPEARGFRATMSAGFARMERHFELWTAWHEETMAALGGEAPAIERRLKSIRARFAVVEARLHAAEIGVAPPRADARRYRRWTEREFAAAGRELRALQQDPRGTSAVQPELDQITAHVANLEHRLNQWRRWRWRDFA